MQQAFADGRYGDSEVTEAIRDCMRQKIAAGVGVPTYPQFQDMNRQFARIIDDPACSDAPFLVKAESAEIIELAAIEPVAKEYLEKTGERLRIRVCVTGAVELYLKQFGSAGSRAGRLCRGCFATERLWLVHPAASYETRAAGRRHRRGQDVCAAADHDPNATRASPFRH